MSEPTEPPDDDWPTIANLDEMAENVAEVGCGDGYEAEAWLEVIKLARAELVRRQAEAALAAAADVPTA